MDAPQVKPGDRVRIAAAVSAIVSKVYTDRPGFIEVVYLDARNQAIVEDAEWKSGWAFAIEGPCGGYADKYSRLEQFVATLRHGL